MPIVKISWVDLSEPVSDDYLLACVIPVACPIAGNTVIVAELFGPDSVLASHLMALSALLSIVTIPAVVFISVYLGY